MLTLLLPYIHSQYSRNPYGQPQSKLVALTPNTNTHEKTYLLLPFIAFSNGNPFTVGDTGSKWSCSK